MANEPSDAVRSRWTPDQPHPNQQRELYCLYRLQGLSKHESGLRAGYKATGRRPHVHTLPIEQDPMVIGRMTYLRQLFLAHQRYDIETWLQQMIALAYTKITDVVNWGMRPKNTSHIIKDPSTGAWIDSNTGEEVDPETLANELEPFCEVIASDQLPEHVQQAISQVDVDVNPITGGCKVRVKLHDKVKPMEMLGKYLGAFAEDGEKVNTGVQTMSPERAAKLLEQGVEQLSNEKLKEAREVAWRAIEETDQRGKKD